MNKRVLITGAAGFIGSHIARRMVKNDYDVHAIIRPSGNLSRITDIIPRINIYKCDLSDGKKLAKIVGKIDPMGIFHLAVSTIMSGITAPPEEVVRTNFLGTVNLFDACSGSDYKFFINTGSFLEREPSELYSITKLAGTLYGQVVAKTKNKPVITFRLFTPYGPDMQKGRLVYELIKNALMNADINLTRPEVVRDFIFVDDIVDLYFEATSKAKKYKGEVFDVASGKITTLKFLANYILQSVNSRSRINWNAFRSVSYDNASWRADIKKTLSCFRWRPKYDIKDGLEKTIEWLKNNPNFYENKKK